MSAKKSARKRDLRLVRRDRCQKMWVNYFSSPFKTSQGVCNKVRSNFFASCAKLIETICLTGKGVVDNAKRVIESEYLSSKKGKLFSISHTIEKDTFHGVFYPRLKPSCQYNY